MRKLLFVISLLFCVAGFGQTWQKVTTSVTTNVGGYWVFTPTTVDANTACIIAFHGTGEQGSGSSSDLDLLLNQGLSKLINDRVGTGNAFPYNCIVFCPQYTGGTPTSGRVQAIIDYVQANFTFNQNKLHLTGLSLGAEAVTNWWFNGNLTEVASCTMLSTPSQFYQPGADNAVAANMPCMFLHGTADSNPFTPFTRSDYWVNGFATNGWAGLNGLGINPAAILVPMVGYDHNTWNDAYDWLQNWYNSAPLLNWILSNSRSALVLNHTLIGRIGSTLYRWKVYSNNTYTVESHNGSVWSSASGFTQNLRGRRSGVNYRWQFASNSTYTQQ